MTRTRTSIWSGCRHAASVLKIPGARDSQVARCVRDAAMAARASAAAEETCGFAFTHPEQPEEAGPLSADDEAGGAPGYSYAAPSQASVMTGEDAGGSSLAALSVLSRAEAVGKKQVAATLLHRLATDADAISRGRGAKVDPRGTLRESRLRSRPV